MADKAKLFRLILIGLIIISLALAAGVFVLFQQERAKALDLQTQLEDVKIKQQKAEAELTRSRKAVAQLEEKLREVQDKIDGLTVDLQKEKDAQKSLLSQIDQLTSDLTAVKEAKAVAEKKFTQAKDDLDKAQEQLKKITSQKTELEKNIETLESKSQSTPETKTSVGVELGKIVVSPDITAQAQAAQQAPAAVAQVKPAVEAKSMAHKLEGEILVINKEYNFAVINLGSNNGAEMGDVFSVYRNDKYLGDLKVEKVHDSMSAAGFVTSDLKDKLSEGDKAVLKNK